MAIESTTQLADSGKKEELTEAQERYYIASSSQLIWRSFTRHKLAIVGAVALGLLYLVAIFADFCSPYAVPERHSDFLFAPPQRVRIFHDGSLHRPFVYGYTSETDPETFRTYFTDDPEQVYPIRLFSRGDEYEFLGIFDTNVHLIGVDSPGTIFLFGTDNLGRDMFSRTISAARISLSIGLLGVFVSFILGCIIGGISGYFGGVTDMIIQRIIEFLISLPTLPLWMALSAALPRHWSALQVYFMITIILSIVGWTGLARVVRSKLLQLREEDYVLAAKIAGAREGRIITRHLLPGFMSYLVVSITLSVPGMILGETALSFIGVGLRPPVVSWGVLLQNAQNVRTVALHPWLLIPGVLIVITVLAFNFVGDGLRDAADPYKQ